MANKISVILDFVGDKATTGLQNFKKSVEDADGATNKFKAAGASAFSAIKANAGEFALAAGAALVAFGVKAVAAFTDTAKAAIDLGAATGLSTEEASRWIAVGDDMGVTAEQLTTSLGKIAKDLDAEKWSKYGIATRDAAGNARDTNDILLDAVDRLGKVTNETDRARIGNELFGKGYANIAPMIGKSRAEYEKMLAAVEEGQVITNKEAEKAEKMRLAQDALSDALREVTIAFGGLVAELAPVIESMAAATTTGVDFIEKVGGPMADTLNAVEIALGKSEVAWGKVGEQLGDTLEEAENLGVGMDVVKKATSGATDAAENADTSLRGLAEAAKKSGDAVDWNAVAADRAERAIADMKAEFDELTGAINADSALLNLQANFDEVTAKAQEAFLNAVDGNEKAESSTRDHALAVNDLKLDVIEYGDEILGLPAERVTELLAMIDEGKLAEVEAILSNASRARQVTFAPTATGFYGGGNAVVAGKRAAGGPVAAGSAYLVGEKGPEILQMGSSSGNVIPNDKLGGGGQQVVINIDARGAVGLSGPQVETWVAQALARHNKRNGR